MSSSLMICYTVSMHELPITQQMIKIAEQHCRDHGGRRVTRIDLVIGDASGYVGSSVEMYFDVISEGTLCQGAELHITHVKPKLRCTVCGHLFERVPFSFACPDCGGDGIPSEVGREFRIETIQIETGEVKK